MRRSHWRVHLGVVAGRSSRWEERLVGVDCAGSAGAGSGGALVKVAGAGTGCVESGLEAVKGVGMAIDMGAGVRVGKVGNKGPYGDCSRA